jgi:hypothetical protein
MPILAPRCLRIGYRQELPEGFGANHEPGRHGNAGLGQFPQARAFSTDRGPVGETDL